MDLSAILAIHPPLARFRLPCARHRQGRVPSSAFFRTCRRHHQPLQEPPDSNLPGDVCRVRTPYPSWVKRLPPRSLPRRKRVWISFGVVLRHSLRPLPLFLPLGEPTSSSPFSMSARYSLTFRPAWWAHGDFASPECPGSHRHPHEPAAAASDRNDSCVSVRSSSGIVELARDVAASSASVSSESGRSPPSPVRTITT